MTDAHVGDEGTILRFTIKENNQPLPETAWCNVKKLRMKKKNREVIERDLNFWTTGSDAMVYYQLQTDDVDSKGGWILQLYVEMAGVGKWHTTKVNFEVDDNLEVTA